MVFYEITKLEAERGEESDPHLQAAVDKLKELRENTTSAYYVLVTIRPKEDETMENLMKCTNKIVNKKWMKDNCLWVYEQKGTSEDEAGIGKHVHIIYKHEGLKQAGKKKSWKKCLEEVTDTCRRMIEIEDNCIDFKPAPKKDREKIFNYLLGSKASEEKEPAQKIDIFWREKLGLKSHYGDVDL